jgi:hypothetical protein
VRGWWSAVLAAEELRGLASEVRRRGLAIDGQLLTLVEREVEQYRLFREDNPSELPPEPLAERLPLLGWLIYEASLGSLWDIASGFDNLAGELGERSRASAEIVARLADAARALPWPQFAPRALGAIRAQALVESKRDTASGFDQAWLIHREVRSLQESYADAHRLNPDSRELLQLDEVLLQLALAETGTACRTAERVLTLWDEEFGDRESERWALRLFRQLDEGAAVGERALEVAQQIRDQYGFTETVTAERLTLPTAFRNPAIMTSRSLLLIYSISGEVEALGSEPASADSWSAFRQGVLSRIDRALSYLLQPVQKADGSNWPMLQEHRRSMVQMCLHLGLVAPGHELKDDLFVDETLTVRRLDDDAVEAMSAWLATVIDGRQRGDANVIGSVSKPSFIAAVEACRTEAGAPVGYREWRRRWHRLDRYGDWPGRRERMSAILDAEAS